MFNKDMKIHIDWRWVGIGYCFFVAFLLLPTYIIFKPVEIYFEYEFPFSGFFIFIGFVSIAFYIGYRSKGIAVFESGISTALFVGTLLCRGSSDASDHSTLETIGICLFGTILFFSLASICAWVGKYVQARKNRQIRMQISEV